MSRLAASGYDRDMMTDDELAALRERHLQSVKEAHQEVEDAKKALQAAKARRSSAVRRASASGVPMGEMATALDVSRPMLSLIAKNER